MAEAKLLRQHKGRLEARMQILEDHNRQLEAQLQRLRQLLDEVMKKERKFIIFSKNFFNVENKNFFLVFFIAKRKGVDSSNTFSHSQSTQH